MGTDSFVRRPHQDDEFLIALKLQTREVDNFTDEIMQLRFRAAVERIKNG